MLARSIRNPLRLYYALLGRLSPMLLFRRYAALARSAGVAHLYFILSFDCDTEADTRVVWDMHRIVTDLGVKPTYAVPSELLRKGESVYRRIVATGARFMNHGYKCHTHVDESSGRYTSCFFYDELAEAVVREDIVRGHEFLSSFLGRRSLGFRTPHFGTFQTERQLSFLYGILAELGCSYSSSTTPLFGFRHGPVFSRSGIFEIPVSGMASRPLGILDSWGSFVNTPSSLMPGAYLVESRGIVERMSEAGCGVINLYVDPSHVHGESSFVDALNLFVAHAIPIDYEEFLELIDG